MLPSKMMPTNSPARFTTGLPELPPMMSAVETKLNGVPRFSFDFRLDDLAEGARRFIDELRERDHWIVGGGIDGGFSALVKFFAHGHVFHLGLRNQFRRARARRFAGEDLLHELVRRAHLFDK